jgi:L-proline amide hydrolase
MLAMAYAITQPAGLASLVVESSPPSVPFWLTELEKLRAELPPEVDATLRAHEAAGTFEDPAYQEAMLVFYHKHVCRMDPWPGSFVRTIEGLAATPEVYNTMNGPSEFHVIGTIKDWDVSADLARIHAPTLIFCGEYDEVTPATAELAHRGIAGSEFKVMEGCSHMSQEERPAETLGMLRDWLARAEVGA